MFFVDLLFVLLIAVLLTAIIGGGYRSRGGGGILLFFFILFIGTWGIGIWITPIGPALFGGYWLSFLLVGVFIALLMAAIPDNREESRGNAEIVEADQSKEVVTNKSKYAFNTFFWVLIVFLLIWIFAYYI